MALLTNWHIHTSYIVIAALLAVGSYIGIHSWLQEHDARLLAQQQEKMSEQVIQGMQDQIKANNDQITTLRQSIKDVSAAAAKQVQVIVKQQEAVKTPQQAITALPDVGNPALDIEPLPDAPDRVSALALPLFQQLSQCKIDGITLGACQKNLSSETTIAETNDANYKSQVSITSEKQKEIDKLKKPKSFWHRVGSTVKQVAISAGIGYVLGKVL